MRVIDIQYAQENLEELIDELKPGESFAVARDGVSRVSFRALTQKEIENWSGEIDTYWPS